MENDMDEELNRYINTLRKVAWYQMYLIAPAFFVAGLISSYTAYYDTNWISYIVPIVCFVGAIHNYYSARRSFAKIMRYKLL